MGTTNLDLRSFYPNQLEIKKIEETDAEMVIHMKSHSRPQRCPTCGGECEDYHSTYKRKIQDLPILGKRVSIKLIAYRYYCNHDKCEQKVFCETVDDFFATYKRMTGRLEMFLIGLALQTSCEGAARVARLIDIKISGDTIIKILLNKAEQIEEDPKIIGVDDWAYKKGRAYGTIIVDGETHKPLDLLDGRDGSELKEWLKRNKQVKIVTRDRASAYAKVIREELPNTMQVADRFHLYQNLLTVIKKALAQEIPEKVKIPQPLEEEAKKKNETIDKIDSKKN